MPTSPELEHLQRAVDAVKRGLIPEKQKEPEPEPDHEPEPVEPHYPGTQE